jgi:hypothetical protein
MFRKTINFHAVEDEHPSHIVHFIARRCIQLDLPRRSRFGRKMPLMSRGAAPRCADAM